MHSLPRQAKALDALASFYESCAQIEIDEYQNYDKALNALEEALRNISKTKMKDLREQEARVTSLQHRILYVKRFCEVRDLVESR